MSSFYLKNTIINNYENLFLTERQRKENENKYEEIYARAYEQIQKGNYDEAEKIYNEGIKYNRKKAYYNLGFLYYYRKKDEKKAKEMFVKAFNSGNYEASSALAYIARQHKDFKEVKKWYKKGGEKGFTFSGIKLGKIYKAEKNYKEAKKWLTKFAEKGNADAIIELIIIYYKENNKGKMNQLKKVLETEVGIEDINYEVLFYFDCIFENKTKLFEVIEKADDLITLDKYSEAEKIYLDNLQYNEVYYYLGRLYWYFISDKGKAKKYYQLGYEKGISENAFRLGSIYEYKEKNVKEAKKWYMKGVEMGNISSYMRMGSISLEENKYLEAQEYYRYAAQRGEAMAIRNLALYSLENGAYREALEWCKYISETPKILYLNSEIKANINYISYTARQKLKELEKNK
jgi:Sel1 repeat protein